jgi:Fe2+ or Zn2+ uptake regulation protein
MQMQRVTGGGVSCTERLTHEMRERGLRLTPQRSVILETVAHSSGHPTAQDVFHLAQERLPGLNLATVYRALEALQSAGLVDSIESGDGLMGFALRDHDHPHHHLVCTSCGGEWTVGAETVAVFATSLRRRHGFRLNTDHVTLAGLCRSCAQASVRRR